VAAALAVQLHAATLQPSGIQEPPEGSGDNVAARSAAEAVLAPAARCNCRGYGGNTARFEGPAQGTSSHGLVHRSRYAPSTVRPCRFETSARLLAAPDLPALTSCRAPPFRLHLKFFEGERRSISSEPRAIGVARCGLASWMAFAAERNAGEAALTFSSPPGESRTRGHLVVQR